MENFGTFTKELVHHQKSKGKVKTNAWLNFVTGLVSKVGCPAKKGNRSKKKCEIFVKKCKNFPKKRNFC